MSEAKAQPEFPLRVGIASLVVTGIGLALCALGVRWQAGPGSGEILERAWVYGNLSMSLMTMAVWPCVHRVRPRVPRLVGLMWEMCAMVVCAVPVLSVCGVLGSVGLGDAVRVAAMQAGLIILTAGILLRGSGWGMAGLGFLAMGMPLMVYVAMEFFPAASSSWSVWVPLMGIGSAASGALGNAGYGMAAIWASVGIGWGLIRRK